MIDFRWMEFGGIYLDPSGGIALTSAATLDRVRDIVQSRLKAATAGTARPGSLWAGLIPEGR
jgi:hypothetical protein